VEGRNVFDWDIPDYNPEWVSIDFRVFEEMDIPWGFIDHQCIPSLDLAFCITSEPEADVPTLNEWGMIILVLLLLTAGTITVVRRRRAAVTRTN
jgi:hypothetical protein